MGRKSREKRERAAARAGAAAEPPLPAGDEELFRELAAFDDGEYDRVPLDVLREQGKVYASAARLSDAELAAELRRVVEDLAAIDVYIGSTDHLSERELYEKLTGEMLLEEMPIKPGSGCCNYLDVIGGFSEEDLEIYYRYYADETERKYALEEFPDSPLPPHETPPYDRDRFLPNFEIGERRWREPQPDM